MDRDRASGSGPVDRPLDLAEGLPADERPPFAVVDIGSNSVRLVVYDGIARAPLPRFNEKSFCRLADGLETTGRLSEDGMRRTLEALRRFRAIADAMGVERVDVLATEATRRATNGQDLIKAIAAETRFDVRILTGAEEATFAGFGVISGFFRPVGLVGDMGGGSLELADVLDDRVGADCFSLPLGALPVQSIIERHGRAAPDVVDRILKEGLPRHTPPPTFYAVGGGWRALAKVHLAMGDAPIQVVHGYQVDAPSFRKFAKSIWKMPKAEIANLPGMPSRRSDTLASAALVMDRVLKRLAPDRLVFSALGVREGWLYSLLTDAERYRDPLVEGAQAWGLHSARVPAFAAALARWTADLFPGETPADQRLRVAACAISDLAWRDHDELRAIESFRRIIQFPFIGVEHAERVFLAVVIHARYGGRAKDMAIRHAATMLSPEAFRRARILGLAMLVGYRYSGSVPAILETSRLSIGARAVTLTVSSAARAPDSEALMNRLTLLAAAVGTKDVSLVEAT